MARGTQKSVNLDQQEWSQEEISSNFADINSRMEAFSVELQESRDQARAATTNLEIKIDDLQTSAAQSNAALAIFAAAAAESTAAIQKTLATMQTQLAEIHKNKAIPQDSGKAPLEEPEKMVHFGRGEPSRSSPSHFAHNARFDQQSVVVSDHVRDRVRDRDHIRDRDRDQDRARDYVRDRDRDHDRDRDRERDHDRDRDRERDRYRPRTPADNRRSIIKRIDMPGFNGSNAYRWIAKVERFFRIHRYDDLDKLDYVSISFTDDALSWFNYEVNVDDFLDWDDLKERLLQRFCSSQDGDPSQQLFRIKQTGTISEFIHEFEDLSSQVTGLDDKKLRGVFMNGLTPEMKEVVLVMKPMTLAEMKAAAITMDTTMLKDVVADKWKAKFGNQRWSKGSTSYNKPPHTWTSKPPVTDTPPPDQPPQQSSQQRPRHRPTPAELDEKKRKGLCFKCDGRYFRGHQEVCPNKTLQLLQVVDGYELEVLDDNMVESTDAWELPVGNLMGLSLNSFLGFKNPTTTKLKGIIGKQTVIFMLDSGATHNFISPAVTKKLKLQLTSSLGHEILLGTCLAVQSAGIYADVSFQLNGVKFTADFIALELGNTDVILGVQWLSTLGKCELDWEKQEMTFVYNGQSVTLQGDPSLHDAEFSMKSLAATTPSQQKSLKASKLFCTATVLGSITHPQHWESFLAAWSHIFAEPEGLPPVRGREHAINLVDGCSAVSVRPYRYPQTHKEAMELLVQEMLAAGIIRNSQSPFSSPVLLVAKKDKSWRFCVDYRALNRVTIPDKYPIPLIDQLLDELYGACVFSKLDLRSGYHQIRMLEKDIQKTAFRTTDGHYEFLVMPFGLTNAPATFQALMNDLFRPFLHKFVLVFFDDILVFSSSYEEHEKYLGAVLTLFAEQQLFANRKKCLFGLTQVDYLGHIISASGVATDPAKTEAMTKWPTPTTVKDLRGFLGLTGYYRRFVKGYGIIAKPLTDLLRKDMFLWSPAAGEAFESLKTAMITAPVLALLDFSAMFFVETDASGYGIGAVLMQHSRPIAFFSHGLTPTEQNKPIYERELMAIVMAITKWKHYLLGRKFTVHTDQKSLKFLLEQREVSMDYQRWLTKLLAYDFDIIYKKGKDNVVADGLSRVVHVSTAEMLPRLMSLTMPTVLQIQDIYKEIDEDPHLQQMLQQKAEGKLGSKFEIRAGRLWYKNRLLIPATSTFIPLLLNEHHNGVFGGHSGVLKTLRRIQQLVQWSGMKKSVMKHVAECTTCQTHKYSTLAPAGLLQPLPFRRRFGRT